MLTERVCRFGVLNVADEETGKLPYLSFKQGAVVCLAKLIAGEPWTCDFENLTQRECPRAQHPEPLGEFGKGYKEALTLNASRAGVFSLFGCE